MSAIPSKYGSFQNLSHRGRQFPFLNRIYAILMVCIPHSLATSFRYTFTFRAILTEVRPSLMPYVLFLCLVPWSGALCLISVLGTLVGMEFSLDLTPVSFGPARLLFATMTSADFSSFVVTAYSLMRPPRVRAYSFVTAYSLMRPPRVRAYSFMLNRHLYLREFRIDIGLRVIWHSCPPRRPEVISVRQFNTLLSLLSAITSP